MSKNVLGNKAFLILILILIQNSWAARCSDPEAAKQPRTITEFQVPLLSRQSPEYFSKRLGDQKDGFAKCEMGLLCSFWSALVVASKLPYRCHFCQVSLLLNHEPHLFPVESETYSASDVLGSDLMCGFYRLCSNRHLCVVLKILT
ncbi:hypothetical protein ILYODFUR_038402 [Ilyodon furcidens]|uniref:Secreted protein n=1 Tax=Ilyodon furcidens TaxID=33524 RepID=A0ABV0VBA5_9TELE